MVVTLEEQQKADKCFEVIKHIFCPFQYEFILYLHFLISLPNFEEV